MLIENIYCNWSGGCAIGSLGADTDISKIIYSNIYTWQSNQMLMIKSNGGSGTVSDCTFENFIGHSNAYSLDINGYWTEETAAAGDGVLFTELTFNNWKGTCSAGETRAPINVICPDDVPCDGITIEDFAMWTDTGSYEYYKCENAWGSGGCLRGGSAHTSYAISTAVVTAAPYVSTLFYAHSVRVNLLLTAISSSGYSAAKMPNDLASGFGLSTSIPIPTIPTTFFPGATPATARAYP